MPWFFSSALSTLVLAWIPFLAHPGGISYEAPIMAVKKACRYAVMKGQAIGAGDGTLLYFLQAPEGDSIAPIGEEMAVATQMVIKPPRQQ